MRAVHSDIARAALNMNTSLSWIVKAVRSELGSLLWDEPLATYASDSLSLKDYLFKRTVATH